MPVLLVLHKVPQEFDLDENASVSENATTVHMLPTRSPLPVAPLPSPRTLTRAEARERLEALRAEGGRMHQADAVSIAAALVGVPVLQVQGPTRGTASCAEARKLAMVLMRESGWSYHEIGSRFGRDHSTVVCACRSSAAMLARYGIVKGAPAPASAPDLSVAS